MKFYKIPGWNYLDEAEDGHYALRADAEQAERARTLAVDEKRKADAMVTQVRGEYEQAAKDAVRAAKVALLLLKNVENSKDEWSTELRAIIERYEGTR